MTLNEGIKNKNKVTNNNKFYFNSGENLWVCSDF